MDQKEKGAAVTAPRNGKERNNPMIAVGHDSVNIVPNAPRLNTRFWEAPRNINSSIARVRAKLSAWAKTTNETAYLVGKEFLWMKNTRAHGEFMDAVAQTSVHIRTARRLMEHARECDQVNRLLPYHPNKKKRDTVSLLEPPPDQDDLEEEKPKHEPGASKEWNATDCAKNLLARYERLVMHRSEDDRAEVLSIFIELAEDSNREFAESRRMIREGSGRMIEEEEL
jgi:hypothetical protein